MDMRMEQTKECLIDIHKKQLDTVLEEDKMAKGFPEIKKKDQGKFTAWAKRNGFKDACSAASAVMKSKKKYSPSVVKMANYAKNFGCSRR